MRNAEDDSEETAEGKINDSSPLPQKMLRISYIWVSYIQEYVLLHANCEKMIIIIIRFMEQKMV